jgi:hypothetical protein
MKQSLAGGFSIFRLLDISSQYHTFFAVVRLLKKDNAPSQIFSMTTAAQGISKICLRWVINIASSPVRV